MYTTKKFKVKPEDEVFNEIKKMSSVTPEVRKVFLADGNAMVLSTDKLLRILEKLNSSFPGLTRISAYARPMDMENKTQNDLAKLKEAGLKLVYVGVETGDDALLKRINKGETAASTIRNLMKLKEAGIKQSIMIINGLGGMVYSKQHAQNSARVVNKVQPEFLSTLVLSFPYGADHYKKRFEGEFIEMNTRELLEEQFNFISQTELHNVIFRSDHASNYLALKGILGRDKVQMLLQLKTVMNNPNSGVLREEWQRGL
jgi:radical SAM superfamily enzyme YgiQ (UPF0313 family)